VPALLQNSPAPHGPAQHTELPCAVATHCPDAQSLPCAHVVPTASVHAPDAGSHTHCALGFKLVKLLGAAQSSAVRHCPNDAHRLSVMLAT
jgi:hypothetical protein